MSVFVILAIVIGAMLFIASAVDFFCVMEGWSAGFWPWVIGLFKKEKKEAPKAKQKTLRIVEKKTSEGESYYVVEKWQRSTERWYRVYRYEDKADGALLFTTAYWPDLAEKKNITSEYPTIEKALEVMEGYKEYLAKQKEAEENEKYSEVMVEE